jgi:hypothetical protein
MHMLIIIAAFAFAAVTPYLGALPRASGDLIEGLDVEDAAPIVEPEAEGDQRG